MIIRLHAYLTLFPHTVAHASHSLWLQRQQVYLKELYETICIADVSADCTQKSLFSAREHTFGYFCNQVIHQAAHYHTTSPI